MEFGIDRSGRIVRHTNAIYGNVYLCPSCNEEVVRVRGEKACFKHKNKSNRTPLERSCPEYHDQKSWRIEDPSDIVYISNGGVPLYLCNIGELFELRAHFPSIRDVCTRSFINEHTQIIIDKSVTYNASDLSYYVVDKIKDWIQVEAEPKMKSYPETQKRWLWGIRGVNIDKDLYYGCEEGGYRLAVNANVYIGKKYRWLTDQSHLSFVHGIDFMQVGEIWLRKGKSNKHYLVQELQLKRLTESARQFIESRGYHLCEKVNCFLPLWPPAARRGNELSMDSDEMRFYHSNATKGEAIYEIENGNVQEVYGRNIYKIDRLATKNEETLLITNKIRLDTYNMRKLSEIKYLLIYKKGLCDAKFLEPQLLIEDMLGNLLEKDIDQILIPQEGKVFIKGNVPITGQVIKDGYCIYSGSNILEHIGYGTEVIINARGFGTFKYSWKRNKLTKHNGIDIDWQDLYEKLYRCKGAAMKPTYHNQWLLFLLSRKKSDKEIQCIYRLLHSWLQREAVPVSAQRYLEEIVHKELE